MKATSGKNKDREKAIEAQMKTRKNSAGLLPVLIAGSACGLMSGPASALQLGDIEIQSALGQPLRASIAFALNPNEQLFNYCILLKPGVSSDGLPMLSRASLSVANGNILLTGTTPLREPMLAVRISVDCPYTANLSRSYTLMLDPAQPAAAVSAPITNDPSVDAAVTKPVSARTQRVSRTPVATAPISLSTEYPVQVGETLSEIAERIVNRPIGLWPAVYVIFDANPDAFINGDINKLKAGSRLAIPSFDNVTAPTLSSRNATPEPVVVAATPESETSAVYSSYSLEESATVIEAAPLPAEILVNQEPVTESTPPADTVAASMTDVQPGDISIGGDTAFVSPIESPTASSIDYVEPVRPTAADPIIEQSNPVVPVVAVRPTTSALRNTNDDWSWMFWLAGSGMALILGLLLFGRRLRDRFGSIAIGAAVDPAIQVEDDTARNEALSEIDFPINDSQDIDLEYTLDADLGAGTGLNGSGEIAVAQDFGFSAEGDAGSSLDMLLPEEASHATESNPTDIIAPKRIEEASILDEEVLPGDDDEYDMSMIVDATKQNIGDEVSTEKDLKAVPFDALPDGDMDVEYTLNDQFGLESLERDYEDELTATQAANKEIEKAAAELALRLADSGGDRTENLPVADSTDISADGITAEMPSAKFDTESTSEVTVQLSGTHKAENEDFSVLDDTGINEELTAQLPSAKNDATAEMIVESGHVNTKKSAG